jgi:hypothetical protein
MRAKEGAKQINNSGFYWTLLDMDKGMMGL